MWGLGWVETFKFGGASLVTGIVTDFFKILFDAEELLKSKEIIKLCIPVDKSSYLDGNN